MLATDWIADHARRWHLSSLLNDELFTALSGVRLDDPTVFADGGVIRRFEGETFTAVRWAMPEHLRDYRPDEFAQRIVANCWTSMLALNSTVPNPVRPFGRINQIDPVLDAIDAWARTVETSAATIAFNASQSEQAKPKHKRYPPSEDFQGFIFEAIRAAGGKAQGKAIALHFGSTPSGVRHAVSWMVKQGLLKKVKGGYAAM
ncbi:hypothetical protein [Limnoglobus roseus]|uniref:hypothetical protein n=1 Tax=Limnoglobus roseus TaxID=2598579 RepID=UPI0011EB67FF|nr:hypothetical protein [Limnoglobus roseus]